MTIDWQKLAAKYQDDMLADLVSLLKIPSVRDESKKTKEAPLGPGPKAALDHFLGLAERDGFKTREFDGLAGHIEFGDGSQDLGILAHVDVMPGGKGWATDPFDPVIKDGNIYARGASDDKGPSMAAYYGLKMVKDSQLPTTKKVRFILGTDEESAWRGMTHYFEKMPKPTFGFSPDAFFPIINGEKGNVTYHLHLAADNGDAKVQLVSFTSGLRDNMVPRDAVAEVTGLAADEVAAALTEFSADLPLTASASATANGVKIEVIGKAAHAQEPRNGVNAATYLATFLKRYDLAGSARTFVDFIADYLHEASRMERFDAAYSTDKMGDLTMNAGIFTFTAGKTAQITLNFRYPEGITAETIKTALSRVVTPFAWTIEQADHAMEPHYVAPSDPLVKTLLNVYHKQTNLPAKEMVVGGGTYGRLLDRGVAFGAMFPGVPDTMHQANEFVPVADLVKAAAIYAEAIYELIK